MRTIAALPLRLRTASGPLSPFATLTFARRTLRGRLSPIVLATDASALFELLHLPVDEAPRLRVPLLLDLAETTVGTALPSFRVGLFAARAEDAFRQRHRESARIVHSAPVTNRADEERRKTLRALIDLAEGSNPAGCWDDQRAEGLLRSQSTPEELRELGASDEVIEHLFQLRVGEEQGAAEEAAARSGGTFTVRVEARFEAAHFLREYRGISEPLHGHSYRVEAELSGRGGGLDADAIAVDFVSAKRKLEVLAKRLDYTCINDVAPFDAINPTAENVAAWFHRELSAAVAGENAIVLAITIFEGPVNSVRYEVRSGR